MSKRIFVQTAAISTVTACVFIGLFPPATAVAGNKVSSTEISEQLEYLVRDASCAELLPIISGPMRPGMIDEKQFDTATAVLPMFIYGYASALGQTFDEARFELIETCKANPDKPFAGFPEYSPDPAFWPESFIEIWKKSHP